MKKIIKIFAIVVMIFMLSACREADVVSLNISKEADNFNVTRRVTVINIRTDTVMLQMTGKLSLQNSSHNELVVIAEVEKGTYQKHFIYLNEYTMYTVEDLSGAEVSPYSYELEFMPQQLKAVKITAHELSEDFTGTD